MGSRRRDSGPSVDCTPVCILMRQTACLDSWLSLQARLLAYRCLRIEMQRGRPCVVPYLGDNGPELPGEQLHLDVQQAGERVTPNGEILPS